MTKPWPAAALAAIAVIASGCGTNGATDTGATSASAGRASSTPSTQERGVRFAECIRAHGVSDFPDPDPDGDYAYGVSVSAEVWTRATTACKSLQPPGTLSSKRTPTEQRASLRFAACIRDHGVEDFPDPVNGEPLVNTYKIPSSNLPGGMDVLNAAMASCTNVMREALEDEG